MRATRGSHIEDRLEVRVDPVSFAVANGRVDEAPHAFAKLNEHATYEEDIKSQLR